MALLKFKRSAVPAKVPSIADLSLGELAINTYDGKVYTKKDDGTQAIVEVGGGGGVQTISSSDGSVTITGTTDINLSVPVTAATNTVLLPVRNNTGSVLAKGTAVYINGALGQNPTVTKAIATGDATSAQTLGLVTANINNNAFGNITLIGSLTNLDTSAYSDGQQLYLSPTTAGALTATKPYAPNHLVYMAVVEHAHPSLGKLFVKVQNGYEMDELHDVSAQNPANNDGLFYNTSTSLWEKKSIVTALGYTPANKAGDTFTGDIIVSGAFNQRQIGFNFYASSKYNLFVDGTTDADAMAIRLGTNNALTFSASRNVTANVDVRAPIFYDTNDTSYYVDPNSTSVLNAVHTWGEISSKRADSGSILRSYNTSAGQPLQFYLDHNLGNVNIGNSRGVVFAGGSYWEIANSVRAPIFYDSNNTAYYLDPNGTSNFVGLTVAGTITGNISGNAATVTNITANTSLGRNSLSAGVIDGLTIANFRTTMFGNAASTYNISTSRWNNVPTAFSGLAAYGTAIAWSGSDTHAFLALNYNAAGAKIGGGSGDNINWIADLLHSSNYTSYAMPSGSSATNSVDVRAPIFYDSNNTGYYVDPATTSNLNGVNVNGTLDVRDSNAQLWRSTNGAYQRVDTRTEATSLSRAHWYGVNSSGGTSNYRHAWYDNAAYFNVTAQDGEIIFERTAGETIVRSTGSFRAPIFYDSNDTAYRIDPNGNSTVNNLYAGGGLFVLYNSVGDKVDGSPWYGMGGTTSGTVQVAGHYGLRLRTASAIVDLAGDYAQVNGSFRAPIFYDSDNTGYYLDPNVGSSLNVVTANEIYNYGWFRSHNSDKGLYNQATNQHWYSDSGNFWNMGGGNLNGQGIRFRDNHQGTVRGYVYYDQSNNVGFLNQDGNWRARIVGGDYFLVDGSSARAPIFYDSNNTAYYLDPSTTGTSLNVAGAIVAGGNVTAYSDIRIKANVETIPDALGKLDQIRGVTYTRTDLDDKQQRYAGVIAQEIEAVLPEAVRDLGNIKAVDYNATIALLIEAVKELTLKVKTLEEKDN